jgi:hypothetical protein
MHVFFMNSFFNLKQIYLLRTTYSIVHYWLPYNREFYYYYFIIILFFK